MPELGNLTVSMRSLTTKTSIMESITSMLTTRVRVTRTINKKKTRMKMRDLRRKSSLRKTSAIKI
jgi:hypothetical protein